MESLGIGIEFFARDTLTVAKDLLGKEMRFGGCAGMIVETEAYRDDPASHAVRRPKQGRLLKESYGYLYIYLVYGMYHCLNFTTEESGVGAVLIRAVEPTRGIEIMGNRRKRSSLHQLTNGPGKICQAFGIGLEASGKPVGEELELFHHLENPRVASSRRVGISRAKALEWRFFIPGNEFVSDFVKREKKGVSRK